MFEKLVPLIQSTKKIAQTSANQTYSIAAEFLNEVIDACVMEIYFPEHMLEKNLCITELVEPFFTQKLDLLNVEEQANVVVNFYKIANESQHDIRDILLRIPAESPNLLAVIQREGKV